MALMAVKGLINTLMSTEELQLFFLLDQLLVLFLLIYNRLAYARTRTHVHTHVHTQVHDLFFAYYFVYLFTCSFAFIYFHFLFSYFIFFVFCDFIYFFIFYVGSTEFHRSRYPALHVGVRGHARGHHRGHHSHSADP